MGGTTANTATTTSRYDTARARPMLRTGDRHGGTTILAFETLTLGRAAKVLRFAPPMCRVARAARRFHSSRSQENDLSGRFEHFSERLTRQREPPLSSNTIGKPFQSAGHNNAA